MPITGYNDPVYDAIKTFLTSNWTQTTLQWPDQDTSEGGDDVTIKVDLFANVYGQQSIGEALQQNNRWDEDGTLWLFFVAPRETPFTNVRGAGKAIANLFRGLTLIGGNLEFGDAAVGPAPDQEGTAYLLSVSIEWRYINA